MSPPQGYIVPGLEMRATASSALPDLVILWSDSEGRYIMAPGLWVYVLVLVVAIGVPRFS